MRGWLCCVTETVWPVTVRPEHMTEFRGDAGSESPLLHTGLCPDREENHHHAADSLSPALYNMLESVGDTRIPWPTANWPVPRDQPAPTAELWTLPPVWRNRKQPRICLLMLPWGYTRMRPDFSALVRAPERWGAFKALWSYSLQGRWELLLPIVNYWICPL